MTALAILPDPSAIESLPAVAEKIGLAWRAFEAGDVKTAFALGEATLDQAKAAANFAARMKLSDDMRSEARTMVGLALEIATRAEIGIADEYERAKEAGVVAARGRPKKGDGYNLLRLENFGLSKERLHHIRKIRDAESEHPGYIKRTIAAQVDNGFEPSRASLRAGIGLGSAGKDARGVNFYQTPRVAVLSLLAHESFTETIWEPACGFCAISGVFEEKGYSVILSDLVDRGAISAAGVVQTAGDFLHSRPAAEGEGPDIVTNPPYGESLNAFVTHALRVHKPRKLALLLNLNFQCGFADEDRNFVMDLNPPSRVYAFKRRLPMMHREGYEGEKASSRMNTGWFVWERNEDGSYGRSDGWMLTRRIDWSDYADDDCLEPGEGGQACDIGFDEFARETPRRTLDERLERRRDEAREWVLQKDSFDRGELRRAVGIRDGDAEALIAEFLAAELVRGPDEGGRYTARVAKSADIAPVASSGDAVLDVIIRSGLAPNAFMVELNSGLTNDLPCLLPSRLFRFPVEFISASRLGAPESRLVLRHPDLWSAPDVTPFLDSIRVKTGIRVEWADEAEVGRDVGGRWRWYHAVDLCTDKHWCDLLETRNFTDTRSIFRAIVLNLDSKSLSLKSARAVMSALGAVEPEGMSEAELLGRGLSPYRDGTKRYIAPNIGLDGEPQAWLTIHGIEGGWLAYIGRSLSVTPEGMERRERGRIGDEQTCLAIGPGDVP